MQGHARCTHLQVASATLGYSRVRVFADIQNFPLRAQCVHGIPPEDDPSCGKTETTFAPLEMHGNGTLLVFVLVSVLMEVLVLVLVVVLPLLLIPALRTYSVHSDSFSHFNCHPGLRAQRSCAPH